MLLAGVVCVKNQNLHLLINHLISIRGQSVEFDYTIVDYGSTPEYRTALSQLVAHFGLDVIKVVYVDSNTNPWRHGRAFNIGIRANGQADVIFTAGADLIYPPNFIEASLDLWKPELVVGAPLVNVKADGGLKTSDSCYYGTLTMASREKWHKVRGYDEDFTHWGREDTDLVERLFAAGLQGKCIEVPAYHQYHKANKDPPAAERNREIYYKRSKKRGKQRNPGGWGEL